MDRLTWGDLVSRPALLPALCVVVGAWLGPTTDGAGSAFLLLAALLALSAIRLRGRTGGLVAALLAFFTLGVGLAALHHRHEGAAPSGEVRLDATVDRTDRSRDGAQVVTVHFDRVDGRARGGRATLFARGPGPELFPGQAVRLFARLKPLHRPDNPGEPDFATARWADGISFSGTFDPLRVAALTPPPLLARWVTREHRALAQATEEVAPDRSSSALFLTLAAGLRAELPDSVEEAFARSGLVHVLSVSGLHVAVLALLVLKTLRLLAALALRRTRSLDARRIAAPLSLPIVWAYVAYTGWQGPAVRSAIMVSLVLLGLAAWRRSDALNSASVAAIAVVIIWPAAVFDLSLQLSFLAIASLLVLAPAVRGLIPLKRPEPNSAGRLRYHLSKLFETALQTACASLAVVLGALPLVASVFGRVSVAGVISNVVCLPLSGVLTLFAAGSAGTFALSPALSRPLLYLGTRLAWIYVRAAEWFGSFEHATLDVPPIATALAVAFFLGLLCFALSRGRARALGLLAPAALVIAFASPMEHRGLTVTFLAVGQGDAIVLSSRGHHALVDGGGVAGGGDVGARVVKPFLAHERIRSLDLAVLTHPHPDHALGLISVLPALHPRELWTGAGAERGPLLDAVKVAAAGAVQKEVELGTPPFQLGEAQVEVLGPPRDRVLLEGVNDQSVVLKVRHGEVTFLLTGDIEAAAEESLAPGEVTVMKAPHHGSRTSSSEAFLARVRPRFVVFCVGRKNRFGFPAEEVVDRYRREGSECFRTDADGAIRFESDGHDVKVTTFHPHAEQPAEGAGPLQVARSEEEPQPLFDDP